MPNLFLESQNFWHQVITNLGRAFGSRPNAWDAKRKSVVRKLLKGKFFSGTCPESTSAAINVVSV